jgi:hypothetical protein
MTRDEHIEYCAKQAELCLKNARDESLTATERFGATLGHVDWLSEKIALEELEDGNAYSVA